METEEMENEEANLVCPVCETKFVGSIFGSNCPNCRRLVSLMDKLDIQIGSSEEDKEKIRKQLSELNAPSIECPFCHNRIPPEIFAFPNIFCGTGTIVVCPHCRKSVGEWGSGPEGSYWVSYIEEA